MEINFLNLEDYFKLLLCWDNVLWIDKISDNYCWVGVSFLLRVFGIIFLTEVLIKDFEKKFKIEYLIIKVLSDFLIFRSIKKNIKGKNYYF